MRGSGITSLHLFNVEQSEVEPLVLNPPFGSPMGVVLVEFVPSGTHANNRFDIDDTGTKGGALRSLPAQRKRPVYLTFPAFPLFHPGKTVSLE